MNNPNTIIESIFNNSVIARFYNMSLRANVKQSKIIKISLFWITSLTLVMTIIFCSVLTILFYLSLRTFVRKRGNPLLMTIKNIVIAKFIEFLNK